MAISQTDFVNTIGKNFWKHVMHNTQLPFDKGMADMPTNRIEYLKALHQRIVHGEYVPQPPRGYIVSQKGDMVARFIPVFRPQDYCVYFYALKKLEDKLAVNRTRGTFGGFSLGGAIRRLEDEDTSGQSSEYMFDTNYNKYGWIDAWKRYQVKAYQLYEGNSELTHFGVIDIANFYDCIRLDILESKVRAVADKSQLEIVNLLFFFLRNSNRKYLPYSSHSVGLPQDEVGDCSRILANFYLQDYDEFVSKLCKERKATYLRYADDQLIAADSEATIREIIFLASKELVRMGLNLNTSKARYFTLDEYFEYWSFDIHKKLSGPLISLNGKNVIARTVKDFEARLDRLGSHGFRAIGLLRRIISIKPSFLSSEDRERIVSISLRREFLSQLSAAHLSKLYCLAGYEQRTRILDSIQSLAEQILFNQFHLTVIKFAHKENISEDFIGSVTNAMDRVNSL